MLVLLLFLLFVIDIEAVNILNILINSPGLPECKPNFEMFDASGKVPNGLMSGNFVDLGNFDQCIQIHETNNKSEVIKGKYCLMKLILPAYDRPQLALKIFGKSFSKLPGNLDKETVKHRERMIFSRIDASYNSTGLIFGWCIPNTCPIDKLSTVLSNFIQKIDPEMQITPVMDGLCQTKDDLKNKHCMRNIIMILFLVLTLFIMIISTLYDMYTEHRKKKPSHIFTAFSVKTNGQKLLSVSNNPDLLPCLNGIKFLTMMWLLYCHQNIISFTAPLANLSFINNWVNNPVNMHIINNYGIDTFFVLSGILFAYGYGLAKDKGIKFSIMYYYLQRYLRLTPVLAVIIWIHATIIGFFGSGPLWPVTTSILKAKCVNYWWTSLLYIQNYYHSEDMCLYVTWYLAVDMQLFVLSPIILIPLWKWPRRTLLVSTVLVLASMASSFAATYFYNLKDSFNIDIFKDNLFMEKYYLATHTRYGPWLMGLMLGYYLYTLKKTGPNRIYLHSSQVAFGWIVGMGLLLSTLFAGHDLMINPYKLGNSIFNGLHRHGWALGLCWVIYACTQGYGGPVNKFLSWSWFQICGRFTYTIYLVHYSILYLIMAASRTSSFHSYFNTILSFWGIFMLSLVISIFLTLAYEVPMVTIEKLFRRRHNLKKREERIDNSSYGIGGLFVNLESRQ